MNTLFLLILSTMGADPNVPSSEIAPAGQAVAVGADLFHCDFTEPYDADYDEWPDGWTRRRGKDYPEFVRIGIVASPNGDKLARALRIQLSGGAASVSSPPLEISSRSSLRYEALIRTKYLKQSKACLVLTLTDADGLVLETHRTLGVTGTVAQQHVELGPITPASSKVRRAILSLEVEPTSSQIELQGEAWFENLRLVRLPRMTLNTNRDAPLVTDLSDASVTCKVSGVLCKSPEFYFQLLDQQGTQLAEFTQVLSSTDGTEKGLRLEKAARTDANLATEGISGEATWKLPLPDFGFYRVKVTMRDQGEPLLERWLSLAAISPLPQNPKGEFGWTLPAGEKPLPLGPLSTLLGQAGIHWAKYPVWFSDRQGATADRVAWFAERLSLQGIELVGMLDQPPPEMLEALRASSDIDIASVFVEADQWQAAIDPVMTRLSLKVRWWQLGGDGDVSFVGYPNLEAKVSEIKHHLERFGQDVRLGLAWRWSQQTPQSSNVPWEFLVLGSNPPLTAEELPLYLAKGAAAKPVTESTISDRAARNPTYPTNSAAKSPSPRGSGGISSEAVRRWVLIEPLPKSQYAWSVRAPDLVHRMIAAKTAGAEAIFVPKPFDNERGLMREDGAPDELFLPWRTTASLLAGMHYLGQIQLGQACTNHVFAHNGKAVMVLWNETTTTVHLQLGEEPIQVDLAGRQRPLPLTPAEGSELPYHAVAVGPLPIFVTGLEESLARWQLAVEFESSRLASNFEKSQIVAVTYPNPFTQGVGGDATLVAPKSWKVAAPTQLFKVATGDRTRQQMEISLQPDANSGPQPVRIDFDILADKKYRFSVYRTLQLGFDDVQIEMTTRLMENGLLRVDQTLTNLSDKPANFQCLLFPPGRRRETNFITNLPRGSRTLTFWLRDGAELIGKPLQLRAEEINGGRLLNYSVTAER